MADETICEPASSSCVACIGEDQASARARAQTPHEAAHRPVPPSSAQDQTYCSTNGFKQEVMCTYSGDVNGSQPSSYVTFETCPALPGDFTQVVQLEVRPLGEPRGSAVPFFSAATARALPRAPSPRERSW